MRTFVLDRPPEGYHLVDTRLPREDDMTKVTEPQFIESTAGQVAAEFARRGIAPDRHVADVNLATGAAVDIAVWANAHLSLAGFSCAGL